MEVVVLLLEVAVVIGLFSTVYGFVRKPKIDESGLQIFCKCTNNINTGESCKADFYDSNGTGHVLYKCSRCGEEYDFNLDLGPFAVANKNPIDYTEYLANKTLYDKYTKEIRGE